MRVLRGTLTPGTQAAIHSHSAHVAVTLGAGSLQMMLPDGKATDTQLKADEVLLMPSGTHSTTNKGKTPIEVIVIGIRAALGGAAFPSSRPGMKMTRVLEDARVETYRVSADASFHEPAGTTHGFDQVIIPLGPGDIALFMDGETTSTWKRGDVRLIGRGVAHESQGGKMAGEMIIVAIK